VKWGEDSLWERKSHHIRVPGKETYTPHTFQCEALSDSGKIPKKEFRKTAANIHEKGRG